MANALKKAVLNLMTKAFTSESRVLAIRTWQPATMYEVDLHMPAIDMAKWTSIQRIVCMVGGDGGFRDYTPAQWDINKKVCTIFIEAEHIGSGSNWVKNLNVGDIVNFAATHAAQLPARQGSIVCFGDGSSVGHFLALKQLTDRRECPLEVIISLTQPYIIPSSFIADNPEFRFVMHPHFGGHNALYELAANTVQPHHTSVYAAGNIPMVAGIRKTLKKNPLLNARIFAHGFWS